MTNAEMAEVVGVSVATIKRWDQEEAEKEEEEGEGPRSPRRPRSRERSPISAPPHRVEPCGP